MNSAPFLFSIDLEDIRFMSEEAGKSPERVPQMTQTYLGFLDEHNMKATFFVMGKVAQQYPALVSDIIARGHEVACHSTNHTHLDKQDKASLKTDLVENIRLLKNAGAKEIVGFRAPACSLTATTQWAYEVLADLGFTYSSSVLPARSVLYGWPGFGDDCKQVSGIWELPMTLFSSKVLSIPFASGVYFRILPSGFVSYAFKKFARAGRPVVGYFHPYDIDADQERFMHPEINNNRLLNMLMYYNRKNVLKKLHQILRQDIRIVPYKDFVNRELLHLS